jgi:ABC-type multidrug transport system ATPase subunit
MQEIINVKGLGKRFGQLEAVKDLSFTVLEGDVYGFLGQNGAGKSTTIRMLLTLIQPTSGSIELFGMPLATHRREILSGVGAVIEKPDVYKYLSAYDNLQLFARLSGIKPSRAMLMQQLEQVGLANRANDPVKTFSQGMKQRLGIAIALVHNPQLVILDEPTNGLDPQGIADIRELIRHLSRELRKTVLVSSHLLTEIEQVATRLIIIDKGRKLVEGTASQLFDPSKTLVTLETFNDEAATKYLQESQWQSCVQPLRDGKIVIELHRDRIPALHADLVNTGIPVLSLQPRHSLEEFFLQVTSGNHV